MTATVAIVGRPNVGKSTLFNRLAGRRLALVHDTPGLTRDLRESEGRLGDLAFSLVDTAGLDLAADESLAARVTRLSRRAVAEADVALLLIDARAGVTPADEQFADGLRRGPTPVVLVANKCEGRAGEAGRLEAYALGLGEPVAISAEHGEGMDALYEAIAPYVKAAAEAAPEAGEVTEEEEAPGVLQLAVVGRPNVGKSTLVNRLIGEERMLTGPEPGITRDAIAVEWRYRDRSIRLVDTAGLRRKARVTEELEKLSVADALRAVRFAHVVVLLLDALQGMERQDLAIARRAVEEGRALVIAVNKCDLVEDKGTALRRVRDRLGRSLPQAKGVPVVSISALTGQNVARLLDAVLAAYDVWNRRVATAELNRWLAAVTAAHPPPMAAGRRVRLKYITQARTRPPTFAVFCSKAGEVPASYLRYLENALREDFDLPGTPVRIHLRRGRSP